MLRNAAEFRFLTQVSRATISIPSKTHPYVHMSEAQKRTMDRIFQSIQQSAEKGACRVYLDAKDPIFRTPDVKQLFLQRGFCVDENSISW